MTVKEKIQELRKLMGRHDMAAYIVPSGDFNGSEYFGDYFKSLEFITGFTGSAGTAVITETDALLWTDGRYFLQAESELEDSGITLMREGEQGVPLIGEYLASCLEKESIVGFDGRVMSARMLDGILGGSDFTPCGSYDLVGEIWQNRPNLLRRPIKSLEFSKTGKERMDKLSKIRERMGKRGCEIIILTALDEVAWTLNLRGDDIPYTPVFMSYLMVSMTDAVLFVQDGVLSRHIEKDLASDGVYIRSYNDIYQAVLEIKNKKVWLDTSTVNYNLLDAVKKENEIVEDFSPAYYMKAVKNDTEIRGMEEAQIADGVAMTKFIFWLKTNVGKTKMTEVTVGKRTDSFRGRDNSYMGPSFDPIVGYKDHGAIVHYSANEESCYEITNEGIVLVDSGGQYRSGTTDVTRTISLGTVTDKMRRVYTATLRGCLNLQNAVFKEGCSGVTLDYAARKPLWDMGIDYNHGTGHGVGCMLCVHEGPNAFRYRISRDARVNVPIRPGMITSDEPGAYFEGEFGIRLENMILCEKRHSGGSGRFFGFRPLTLVPFDRKLTDLGLMSQKEQRMLWEYHTEVYDKISPYLTKEEQVWLEEECALPV